MPDIDNREVPRRLPAGAFDIKLAEKFVEGDLPKSSAQKLGRQDFQFKGFVRDNVWLWVQENRGRAIGWLVGLVVVVVSAGFIITSILPGGGGGENTGPEEVLLRTSSGEVNAGEVAVARGGEDGSVLKAYIVGAVVSPGVYEFKSGDRVQDLIVRAGGVTAESDPYTLNLASRLFDEQKICVPLNVPETEKHGCEQYQTSESSPLVDINSASAQELDTLVGIGPALAKAIVDYRSQNGDFESLDGLVNISGITPNVIEKFRSYATAR